MVRINYNVKDGRIEWDYDSLEVEVFRRIPNEEVSKVVKEITAKAEEITTAEISYEIEEVGETELGDVVYYPMLDSEFAGALLLHLLTVWV